MQSNSRIADEGADPVIFDNAWAFDPTPKTVTAQVISTNVNDQGSAKKVFEGTNARPLRIAGHYFTNSGTNPTMRVQFVGADDAALTSNVLVLADTGVSEVLTAGQIRHFEIVPSFQQTAKRFYGAIYIPGGTTPNIDVVCGGTFSGMQSAYQARKAAVP
jgi:hypothetical protein